MTAEPQPDAAAPVRLILVDDHEMVIEGLKAMLAAFSDRVRVVGQAVGAERAAAVVDELQPDIVGCTAITPAIYQAEATLQWAKEVNPDIVTVLGGIHGTFMYPQVLAEAPWIDAVVRGEGEAVFLNFVRAVDDGRWARDRHSVRGIAFLEDRPRWTRRCWPPRPSRRSPTWTASAPTGASCSGTATSTSR